MLSVAGPPRHPRQKGEHSRDLITAVLRRRRAAGESWPTVDEICAETKLSKTNVRHHLAWLEEARIVAIVEAKREVSRLEVVLTEGGAP